MTYRFEKANYHHHLLLLLTYSMEIDGNCDENERLKPQTSNTKLKKSYREKKIERERIIGRKWRFEVENLVWRSGIDINTTRKSC